MDMMSSLALVSLLAALAGSPSDVGEPTGIHVPSGMATMQVDPDLFRIILIAVITDALRKVFCIEILPSTLRCTFPDEE